MEYFKKNRKNVYYLYEVLDSENDLTIDIITRRLGGEFNNIIAKKYAYKIGECLLNEVNGDRSKLKNRIVCIVPDSNSEWNPFLMEIVKSLVEYTGMTNASRILIRNEYNNIKLKNDINVQDRKVLLIDGIIISDKDVIKCRNELINNGAIKIRTVAIASSQYEELNQVDADDNEGEKSNENYSKYDRFCKAVERISPNSIEIVEHYRYIKRPKYSEINGLIHRSQNGDREALDLIVKYYFRYICNLSAYYFNNYNISMEDAMFHAIEGLIEQVKIFDLSKHFDFNKYTRLRIINSIRRKSQIDIIDMYYPAHFKEKLWNFKKLLISECYIESPQLIEERVKAYKYFLSDINDEYYGFEDTEGVEWFEYYNDYLDYYYNKDEENSIDIKEINRDKYNDEAYLREDVYCCTSEIIIDNEDIIRIYNNMLPTINIYDLNENEFSYEIEDKIENDLLKEDLNDILLTLTPKQAKIIKLRFGLEDGRARTLEEIAKEIHVTRERIRQIESKALKRLRHPSRSTKIKDYYYN